MTEIKLAASLLGLLVVIGYSAAATSMLVPSAVVSCAWVAFCLYWESLI